MNTYHKLINIIKQKHTAVCLSLDTDTIHKGLEFLNKCAPYICMVKLHPELFTDWDSHIHPQLIKQWSSQYNILIMLDAKLVDVPEISYRFLMNSHYRANEWADMVTVMSVNYVTISDYLRSQGLSIATIPVTEMNTGSPLFALTEYQQFIKDSVLSYPGLVGIINQKTYSGYEPIIPTTIEFNSFASCGVEHKHNLYESPNSANEYALKSAIKESFLKMTPGVVIYDSELTGNIRSSRYRTIKDAMLRDGNDIVIIGGSLINKANWENKITGLIENARDAASESMLYSKFANL